MTRLAVFVFMLSLSSYAQAIPSKYNELLDFVTMAPDQGESGTCLYVASTGAMELIANKSAGIRDPRPYGKYDLAESFLIHAPEYASKGRSFWEVPILKFNRKNQGIHIDDWAYDAWPESDSDSTVWDEIKWEDLPKVKVPKISVFELFSLGNRWSTNVLSESHINKIKNALWEHRSPVLVNYNDNGYWHVILIVGFDDELPGTCYEINSTECAGPGSFYVRDHFGMKVEIRDYDWFKKQGNAAFVIKEVK